MAEVTAAGLEIINFQELREGSKAGGKKKSVLQNSNALHKDT